MKQGTICNMCGRELDEFDRDQSFTIHGTAGYGSVHDGDIVDLNLCCGCFDRLVEQCAVNPIAGTAA